MNLIESKEESEGAFYVRLLGNCGFEANSEQETSRTRLAYTNASEPHRGLHSKNANMAC
jgi:hypothetical protein